VDVADDVIEGVVEGDGVPDGVGVGDGVFVGDSEILDVADGGKFEGVVEGVLEGVGEGEGVGVDVGVDVGVGVGDGVDVRVSVAFPLSLEVAVPEGEGLEDFVDVELDVNDLDVVADKDGLLDLVADNVAIDVSVGFAEIVASFDALAVAEGDADPEAVAEEEGRRQPQTTEGKLATSTAKDSLAHVSLALLRFVPVELNVGTAIQPHEDDDELKNSEFAVLIIKTRKKTKKIKSFFMLTNKL